MGGSGAWQGPSSVRAVSPLPQAILEDQRCQYQASVGSTSWSWSPAAVQGALQVSTASQGINVLSSPGGDATVETLPPPWWVQYGIVLDGRDENGIWNSTFSQEQQDLYGIAEDGSILDQEKFDAAVPRLAKVRPTMLS